ncbi:limonene-1,2-epoxide hydrolase family protein [Arthrobacter sp. CC3]|uniref:nuclear transport factor 2 family protein n=1 Tax=Arthrobacter sp. CC3 TaxID=3029185 RepID=UPI0032631E73
MTVEAFTDEERLVLEFFEHWEERDIEAIVGYFAADGSYIDMPLPPRRGTDAIRAYLTEIFGAFTVKIETLAMASRGETVFTERIDYLIRDGHPTVDLPVTGVMEIRDGKIAAWRDYLDLKTVEAGLAVSYDASADETDTVSVRNV